MSDIGQTFRRALERSGITVKEMAMDSGISTDAFYAFFKGKRDHIPADARPRISEKSVMAGIIVALEGTGYEEWFKPFDDDRHLLTIITRDMKEDDEATEIVRKLPYKILGKFEPDDLDDEDWDLLEAAKKEVSERVRADLYLLAEVDEKFRTRLAEYLTNKEKRAV